jgi:Ni,Fe-hydrogenase III large subunit/Ni,Fe-hydrogenase III component G
MTPPVEARHYRRRRQIEVNADQLLPHVTGLLADDFRLALMAAHEDSDRFRIVYLFVAARPDRRVELVLCTNREMPTIPSLASVSFTAGRFEREIRDLYGVTPVDHPLPARLVRHQHWPRGWYPMRSDAGPPPPFGSTDEPYPFLTVEGPGVYEIPVGPIHAGLIEPGHFRLSVVGETILKLKARLWFVHRGIEKLAEGKLLADVVPLVERVSGDTAIGHTVAFCLAAEEALDWPVSPRAQATRAALLELERLYNHVTDLGALCNDAGQGLLNTHALRIRERLLRLNAWVTGHRLLRGAVFPGGARLREVPTAQELQEIAADVGEIVDLAVHHTVVNDRFTGTAVLDPQQVRDLGVVGYAARASGIALDARRDHPFSDAMAGLRVVTQTDGDVMARFLVRGEEVQASITLLGELLGVLAPGEIATGKPTWTPQVSSGVGLVEGWRGTITHRVEVDPGKRVSRLKIVDPSFLNWPALPLALQDTIVPDFPLTNKSFNLSYAGNDL